MVTVSILYVMRLFILHYALPNSVLYWVFCYIYFLWMSYSSTMILSNLRLHWFFVYVKQSNCWLYFILVILFYISPVHGLLYHFVTVTSVFVFICLWMLYPRFLRYVGVIYTIYSLILIHLGRIFIYIYCKWFIMPLSPSSFTCIHNSGLTSLCFNYLSQALKHISLFLVSQYLIYLFLL